MVSSMTGFEFASLCLVGVCCALPVLCVTFIAWKTQMRDARTIEKLTAANIALSGNPHLAQMANTMAVDRPPSPNGAQRQPQQNRMIPVQ